MDGKIPKGSSKNKVNTEEIKALNTISIYFHNYGVSLVQNCIEDKSQEISMGPELIKKIFLLLLDFEKEIENVFKLLNTDDIVKLLEKNT